MISIALVHTCGYSDSLPGGEAPQTGPDKDLGTSILSGGDAESTSRVRKGDEGVKGKH